MDLNVVGSKTVEFADGTSITFGPQQDKFSNTLFGTLNHLLWGKCEFEDKKNGIYGWYEIGTCGRQYPKDQLKGQILKDGKVISEMFGNYMSHLEFDGKRYFDIRDITNYHVIPLPKTAKVNPKDPNSMQALLLSDS